MRVQCLYVNLQVASVYFSVIVSCFLLSGLSMYGDLGVNCFCYAVPTCFRV